jgi:hypothetical protein
MVSNATLQMSPSVRMLGLPPDVIIVLPSELPIGRATAIAVPRKPNAKARRTEL